MYTESVFPKVPEGFVYAPYNLLIIDKSSGKFLWLEELGKASWALR